MRSVQSNADADPFASVALSNATPRSPSVEELVAFERMLADLSARLANVPGDQVEAEIRLAQVTLRQFLGFDRSTFAEFQDDGLLVVVSSTAVEGVEVTPLGPLPTRLAWFIDKLRAGETFMVQDPAEDLPPEAVGEVEYFQRTGLHSHLSIPLRVGGRVVGAIAFASFKETRTWPEDLIARIRLAGEVFAHAVARKREQEKLLAAMAEIRLLKERLERENSYLKQAVQAVPPQGLTSRSLCFLSVVDEIKQVAQTSSTVLLLGETGSGKEVLAQAIHDASARKDRPMIKVNCAALPASLIESELFGREKGAFTGALARQPGRFEIADGSTIFLDEVGELPLELQPKLLRVLQDGEFERLGGSKTIKVDARVIAANHAPFDQEASRI
jgi:formate hydrogenlyase transcriptional activator